MSMIIAMLYKYKIKKKHDETKVFQPSLLKER